MPMLGAKASWLNVYLELNEAGALTTIAPPKFGTGEGEEVVGLIAPPRFGVVEVSALRGSTDSGDSAGMKAGMKAVCLGGLHLKRNTYCRLEDRTSSCCGRFLKVEFGTKVFCLSFCQ